MPFSTLFIYSLNISSPEEMVSNSTSNRLCPFTIPYPIRGSSVSFSNSYPQDLNTHLRVSELRVPQHRTPGLNWFNDLL